MLANILLFDFMDDNISDSPHNGMYNKSRRSNSELEVDSGALNIVESFSNAFCD